MDLVQILNILDQNRSYFSAMFEKVTLSSKTKIASIYLSLKTVGSNKHANTEKRLRIVMLIRRGIFFEDRIFKLDRKL